MRKRSWFWILALVVLGMTPPPAEAQWSATFPGAAYSPGAENTQWVSDVRMFNPHTEGLVVNYVFTPLGGVGTPVPRSRSISAQQHLIFDNIVMNEFALTGVAGYLTVTCEKQLVVGMRTYNQTAEGTYGQYITDFPTAGSVYFTGMLGGDYRTNLGLVNGAGSSNTFTTDIPGLTITPNPFSPGFALQFGQIQNGTGFNPAGESGLVSGTADFVGYTSVVDNRSGDPTYYPGQVPSLSGAMAGLAHSVGAQDTNWRSDLYLYAPTATQVNLTFVPFGITGIGIAPQMSVPLAVGETIVYEDVVSMFASGNSAGTLFFESTVPVVIVGRTYNVLSDKTYGQTILPSEWVPTGSTGVFLFAAKAANLETGYRANLCLINPGDQTLTATVTLTGLGVSAAPKPFQVPPHSALQQNDVVGWLGESYLENGVITVTGDAPFSGYLSHVDNVTGDGSTVTPGIVYSDQPPTITTISAPATVTVGTTATYRFLVTDDGTRGNLQVRFYNPATASWTAWEDADPVYNEFTVYFNKVGTFTWKVEAFDQVNTVQISGQTTVEDQPCDPPSVTSASVSPTSCEVGDSSTVSFNTSGDVDSFEVEWGDGTTNSSYNHTWTSSGNFTVKVRVYGCSQWSSWRTAGSVSVSDPCIPISLISGWFIPSLGAAPLSGSATANWEGTPPASITVNWGDGTTPTTVSANSSPTDIPHTYTSAGFYIVNISGSNACGSDTGEGGGVTVF